MTNEEFASTETITLTQRTLGLDPYVLLIFGLDGDGDMAVKIEAGGGCDDPRSALLMALSGHDPLTAEEIEMLTAPRGGDGA